MSRLKDHLNYSGARTGYCAWTEPGRASCRTADKGTWNADLHNIRSMADCVAKCRGCANCRYVSLSLAPAHRDCSWYRACDLSRLHPAPRSGPDYASVPVLK